MIDDTIHIELHNDSVYPYKYDDENGLIIIDIRMDSELGKKLKKLVGSDL